MQNPVPSADQVLQSEKPHQQLTIARYLRGERPWQTRSAGPTLSALFTCSRGSFLYLQLHAAPILRVGLVKETGRSCEGYGMTTMNACGSGSTGIKTVSMGLTLPVSWNGWRRVICCVSNGHPTSLFCALLNTTTKCSVKKSAWWIPRDRKSTRLNSSHTLI